MSLVTSLLAGNKPQISQNDTPVKTNTLAQRSFKSTSWQYVKDFQLETMDTATPTKKFDLLEAIKNFFEKLFSSKSTSANVDKVFYNDQTELNAQQLEKAINYVASCGNPDEQLKADATRCDRTLNGQVIARDDNAHDKILAFVDSLNNPEQAQVVKAFLNQSLGNGLVSAFKMPVGSQGEQQYHLNARIIGDIVTLQLKFSKECTFVMDATTHELKEYDNPVQAKYDVVLHIGPEARLDMSAANKDAYAITGVRHASGVYSANTI